MRWTIAATFFRDKSRWIDDYTPPSEFTFRKIPPPHTLVEDWHTRSRRQTSVGRWRQYFRQAAAAMDGDGVVTVFPQLALAANVQRKLRLKRKPMVAWCYNIGKFPTGAKRTALRAAMSGIERIVVHSRAEVGLVSDLLGTASGTVQFVPLQRAPIARFEAEETAQPFAIAMGSANRDYATLFEAARISGLPLTVVASPLSVAGLSAPDNVTILSGLSSDECRRLAQRARFSVVPLQDSGAASGQVTVLEAMRMESPVIATRSIGTEDYIADGATGLLVPTGDATTMATQMQQLWDDAALRHSLTTAATRFAEESLSDEAAGASLLRILREAKAVSEAR